MTSLESRASSGGAAGGGRWPWQPRARLRTDPSMEHIPKLATEAAAAAWRPPGSVPAGCEAGSRQRSYIYGKLPDAFPCIGALQKRGAGCFQAAPPACLSCVPWGFWAPMMPLEWNKAIAKRLAARPGARKWGPACAFPTPPLHVAVQ